MSLFPITSQTYPVIIDLAYGKPDNFCHRKIYDHSLCFLHINAKPLFEKAITLAQGQGLKLKILDAFRPQAAQNILWETTPNPMYVAPPHIGSNHTRGVAIDLTLVKNNGEELDMGTAFDSFEPMAHHGFIGLSPEIARNRYLLLAIMMSAGWDLYINEWWHYQLFKAKEFPLIESSCGMVSA